MPAKGQYRYTREQLEAAVATSKTIADVLRKLGLTPRGGNYEIIKGRIAQWDIDGSHLAHNGKRRRQIREDDEEIRRVVAAVDSKAEAIRMLGGEISTHNYRKLRAAIHRLGLDTSHMSGPGWRKGSTTPVVPPTPLEEVLVKGRRTATSTLRRRLIEEGLKEHRCEACGRTKWQGLPIPLELDHCDGDRTDNRIENLRLLCPNCHALTPTYRGRNIGNGRVGEVGEQTA